MFHKGNWIKTLLLLHCGATKLLSMILYLLDITVHVTEPLHIASSKKKRQRMNVAVNPHQTYLSKSEVESLGRYFYQYVLHCTVGNT